ncbi:MAG: beta-ketoacyl-ACP synthase II [Bacillota bacterium]|jgi:3-oxoacyl-[acyl-carrier-protein] synthase II
MEKRVVVTGVGAVTPVGNDVPTAWRNLLDGKSGIDCITAFDTEEFKVKIAAELKDFVPTDYIAKSELKRTDSVVIYALAAATQAMEDSGLTEYEYDPERLGVYIGSGIGGMHTFYESSVKLDAKGPKKTSPFMIPMMISNVAAGTVAIKYKAEGPCLPVVTACATGTHAVGEAMHAIKHGYADMIIAGGAEACITKLAVAGFTACMALSENNDPKTACRPFDKNRDGFILGEGAGALILEEYEHAKARGAKIYAEVLGYGNTCDAHHVTAPEPEGKGAAKAIALAMNEAGLEAFDGRNTYLNAHGTSTPLNDKTETMAIKKAMGEEAAHNLMISSTKSMTGHLLGAAGAVEAVVCVKSIEDGQVPPTVNYNEPDSECDLDYVPNQSRRADVNYAFSTSLGFGGHNGCLIFGKVK